MANEKRSNSLMEKMDGLSSFPGEASFNKDAAWNRLQQRTPQQPTQKKALWYWWAAAAILLISMLPFLLRRQPPQVMPSIPLVSKPAEITPAPVIVAKQHTVPDSTGTATVTRIKQVQRNAVPPIVSNQDQNTDTNTIVATVTTPPQQDSLLATVSPSPVTPPRKMRVVHINEVGGDVIGNTYVYPEHKQFKVAISGPAGFASQIVADKPSDINKSPKN